MKLSCLRSRKYKRLKKWTGYKTCETPTSRPKYTFGTQKEREGSTEKYLNNG